MPEDHTLGASLRKSLSERVAEWIVGVLAVALFAMIASYGDTIFDAAERGLGKRGFLTVALVLVLAAGYSTAHAFRSRHRKTAVERLRPVTGKGYGIDPVTGEAACPRCSTETRLVFMSDQGNAFYCYVCGEGVLK